MNRLPCLMLAVALVSAPALAGSDSPSLAPPDARVAAALAQISSKRVRADIETLVSFGTRSTLSAQDAASIRAGRGIGAAREWIKAQLEQYSADCGGCLEVKTDAYMQQPAERVREPTPVTNVYAILRGTDPVASARIVLVTGHYDSRNSDIFNVDLDAPGANDDASGTAVSLESARVLSRLTFPGTIIFLAVAGEEQGLLGSAHFAHMARSAGWNLEAVLNDDIVGGNQDPRQDPHRVRVFSRGLPDDLTPQSLRAVLARGAESDSQSRQLARYIADVGAEYRLPVQPMLVFRMDRYGRGGDHSSFNSEGYAAVRFTEFREDYNRQHQNVRTENGVQYGDLPKWVDFEYVANVARLNAATLATLAAAPAAPGSVVLLTANQENQTTLQWAPVPGARSYEVVWRDTTSPSWQHSRSVQDTTLTLDMSKDAVIFGVRAVDAKGRRSLIVIPDPKR